MDAIRSWGGTLGTHISHVLVNSSASSWIVAGTITFAAASAATLNEPTIAHSRPARTQQVVTTSFHHCHEDSGDLDYGYGN